MRERSIKRFKRHRLVGSMAGPGALGSSRPSPLSPLLPDLSDLESAFLHFTFLPVRRQVDRTRGQGIRVRTKASRGAIGVRRPRGGPLRGSAAQEGVTLTDDDEDAQQEQYGSQSHAHSLYSVIVWGR